MRTPAQPARQRRGNVMVLFALLLLPMIAMAAFAIDIGYISHTRAVLQSAAESAALAALEQLPDSTLAASAAQQYGQFNLPDKFSDAILTANVETGKWDEENQEFIVVGANRVDAVRVTATLTHDKGNPLQLFFGPLIGKANTEVHVSAVATRVPSAGMTFLIDEDMLDSGTTAIEDLADQLNRDKDELVTARGFNAGKKYNRNGWSWADNFLDIPAGTQISLPTGQAENYDNNDAGLFEIGQDGFTFEDDAALQDFLMYSETGNDNTKWGSDKNYIKNKLDPLNGVSPVTNGGRYESFVDPHYIHVSPVFPSDISTLNKQGGKSRVNAKGLRRGLLAYRVVGVGPDTDGNGSQLPELVIEIADPSEVSLDDIKLEKVRPSGGGVTKIVQ